MLPVEICCGRSHSLGNRPRKSFVGQKFIWGLVFEYTPEGEERKVGASREGGLSCSHNGDLSQPQGELWSWMAHRVVSNGVRGPDFYTK